MPMPAQLAFKHKAINTCYGISESDILTQCKYSYTTLLNILKISNRTKTSQNKIKKNEAF